MIAAVLLIFYLALVCLITVLLESIPVLFVRNRSAWWRAGILCNVVTNPIINLLMLLVNTYIPNQGLTAGITLLLESAVVITEAWLYRKMLHKSVRICFVFSLIANALSWSIGAVFLQL